MNLATDPTLCKFRPADAGCSPVQARALGSAGEPPRPAHADRGPERANVVLCATRPCPSCSGFDPACEVVCVSRCPGQVEGRRSSAGGVSQTSTEGPRPKAGERRRLGVSRLSSAAAPPAPWLRVYDKEAEIAAAAAPPPGWPRLVTSTSKIAHLSFLTSLSPLCGRKLFSASLDVQTTLPGCELALCSHCVRSWRALERRRW